MFYIISLILMEQLLITESDIQSFLSKYILHPFEYPNFLQLSTPYRLPGDACNYEHFSTMQFQKKSKATIEGFNGNRTGQTKNEVLHAVEQIKYGFPYVCNLLFPQGYTLSHSNGYYGANNPLDIGVLDTLLYDKDQSIKFLFRDDKKGLVKTKNRNRLQMVEAMIRRLQLVPKPAEQCPELGYIAILKYNDGTSTRLKENQLKGIFTTPVYANQRLKNIGNTQYIQVLSQNNEHYSIQFSLQKFKDEKLFKAVVLEMSRSLFSEKSVIEKLRVQCFEAYLYCLVFRIYSYLFIFHNKKVLAGTFQFCRQGNQYFLMGVSSLRVMKHKPPQYRKFDLITPNILEKNYTREDNIIVNCQREKNPQEKAVQGYLQHVTNAVSHRLAAFANSSFKRIHNPQDAAISKNIFRVLNADSKHNLHYLLQNPLQLQLFLLKNQLQIRKVFRLKSNSTANEMSESCANKKICSQKSHNLKKNQNQYQAQQKLKGWKSTKSRK